MSDKVRQRNILYSKLNSDDKLSIDEQAEIVEFMRNDLIKQRNMYRYIYSGLIALIGIGCLYGMTQEQWGLLPNVVRVLTAGRYNYIMVVPNLSACVVICTLTILFTLWPWMRICFYVSLAVPFFVNIIWIALCHLKWKEASYGICLLPDICLLLPIIAYMNESRNRKLWSQLDHLEEMSNKFKVVYHVCIKYNKVSKSSG